MDFNCRSIDEQLYVNSPEITFMLDIFLQEIDVIFSTEKSTVFGHRAFGINIEHLLWSTSFNSEYLSSMIKQEIQRSSVAATNFRYDVNVSLMKGVSRDIGVIELHIKTHEDNTIIAKQKYIFK